MYGEGPMQRGPVVDFPSENLLKKALRIARRTRRFETRAFLGSDECESWDSHGGSFTARGRIRLESKSNVSLGALMAVARPREAELPEAHRRRKALSDEDHVSSL